MRYVALPELLNPAERLGVDEAERFVLGVCQGELDVPGIAEALPRFAVQV